MALHTRKQLQTLCGIEQRAYIATYIKRGNIIEGEGGLIDDELPENKFFIEKQLAKLKEKKPAPMVKEKKVIPDSDKTESTQPEVPEETTEKFKLSIETTKQDLEKKQIDARIALLKEEKLRGEVIPTNMAVLTIKNVFTNYTTAFKNVIENHLLEITKRVKLPPEDVAEMRGLLITSLNEAQDDAINESKKSIKNIIQEYSILKGVGERN